jgi:hypothetical protein
LFCLRISSTTDNRSSEIRRYQIGSPIPILPQSTGLNSGRKITKRVCETWRRTSTSELMKLLPVYL